MIEVSECGGECSACDAPIGSETDPAGFMLSATPPSERFRYRVAMDAHEDERPAEADAVLEDDARLGGYLRLCSPCIKKMAAAMFVVVGGDVLGLRLKAEDRRRTHTKHPMDAKRRCPACKRMSRITTVGCDHCDHEDK